MVWIVNVSYNDIMNGNHPYEFDDNTILIQIVDPVMEIPTPAKKFFKKFEYSFCDAEDDDKMIIDEFKINETQAAELVNILTWALDNKYNVVVHCLAGCCRSGAVAEVGVMMGFEDKGKYRMPNTRVKRMMLEKLGWMYNESDEIIT